MERPKKYISPAEGLLKLQAYCVYQDRCHEEVKTKLISLGIYGDDLEDIMSQLIEDNFLNEERFAQSYARGKFRFKQWGRIRIKQELKLRRISPYCIQKAMAEIDEDEYLTTIQQLFDKKRNGIKPPESDFELVQEVIRKGFESDIVWEVLKNNQ